MGTNGQHIRLSIVAPDGIATRQDRPPLLSDHVPKPISRFASPSCPWPWAGDLEADKQAGYHGSRAPSRRQSRADFSSPIDGPKDLFSTRDWTGYPEQFFPNWVQPVQNRIYPVELGMDNVFRQRKTIEDHTSMVDLSSPTTIPPLAEFLNCQREANVRLRCLCVDNLSGSVLKTLGTHFRIEPFFFSSVINRIPSRYHEELPEQHGDHLYITLPFLRVTENPAGTSAELPKEKSCSNAIDIFADLELIGEGDKRFTLQQDMLAVLVVRATNNHTLITVHPGPVPHSARTLADRLMAAGQGVYWGNLLERSHDPVFLLLIVMWSAIYAWDEAMSALYTHVTHLEERVMDAGFKNIEEVSPQVHAIRAKLLWHDDLLDHFKKSFEVIDKAGPTDTVDQKTREISEGLLKKEIKTLLNEVDRLHRQQKNLDERLGHVMKLVVSILSIKETRTSLIHSESMKQITYLTTIYLPATFVATVFGMNTVEIVPGTNGTLIKYLAAMIPLTLVTIWLAGFMTVRVERPNMSRMKVVLWPASLLIERAKVIWNSARKLYLRQRERARPAGDTLQIIDEPLQRPTGTPTVRSRNVSPARGRLREHRANHSMPPIISRPNSTAQEFPPRIDTSVRLGDMRPQSAASSKQSDGSTEPESSSQSPDNKSASHFELRPVPPPILTRTSASDPSVPRVLTLNNGYAQNNAGAGPHSPGMLLPLAYDRGFVPRSEGALPGTPTKGASSPI